MKRTAIVLGFSFGLLSLGCGLLGDGDTDTDAGAAEGGDAAAEGGEAASAEGGEAAGGGGGGGGGGAAAPTPPPGGVAKYASWAPVHALLDSRVTTGAGVSGTEAMVITADNHVGVTRDAGSTWSFNRHVHGRAIAVDGFAGGPYVAVGLAGYAAISDDGVHWRDLPSHVEDDLIAVVASDSAGIVAVGKRGGWVRFDRAGSTGSGGWLPDKFKAKAVTELNGAVVAYAGKKAYGTADGTTWAQLESTPALPSGKEALTSAGACKIGKVGKKKGIVCTVAGTAHGVTDNVVAVESKGIVSISTDGGSSWSVGTLPFKGANAIFGEAGGPYYAVGKSGSVAKSTDGALWVDQEWEESASLYGGIVDGSTVIIVGDKGTIIYSRDAGANWDYAAPPVGGSFKTILKNGPNYMVTDGRSVLVSADVTTWVEDYETEAVSPGKPGACEGMPTRGFACKFSSSITTPDTLPDVRSFSFAGDYGLAMGDNGAVAFTSDGGRNWNARSGLGLGRVALFDVEGNTVLASNGSRILASNDGGTSWLEGSFVGKPRFSSLLIAENGNAYAASSGTIWVAGGTHNVWLPAQTKEKDKTKYLRLYDVGGAVYAAGAKGELWRSEDGTTFTQVPTPSSQMVQAMAGDAEHVFAITSSTRRSGNVMYRSDDGGRHFYSLGERADWSAVRDFEFEGGKLMYNDRVSTDLGSSWTREVETFWGGAEDTADGSGLRLVNRGSGYSRDRFYVLTGTGEREWVLLTDVWTEGAGFKCDETSGCWMTAGGTVYRPI